MSSDVPVVLSALFSSTIGEVDKQYLSSRLPAAYQEVFRGGTVTGHRQVVGMPVVIRVGWGRARLLALSHPTTEFRHLCCKFRTVMHTNGRFRVISCKILAPFALLPSPINEVM